MAGELVLSRSQWKLDLRMPRTCFKAVICTSRNLTSIFKSLPNALIRSPDLSSIPSKPSGDQQTPHANQFARIHVIQTIPEHLCISHVLKKNSNCMEIALQLTGMFNLETEALPCSIGTLSDSSPTATSNEEAINPSENHVVKRWVAKNL